MRRTVLIAVAAFAALAAVPAVGAIPGPTGQPVKVHVTPGTGGPRTTFTLSYPSPAQVGTLRTLQRSQFVEIHGTHRRGCVWSGQMAVPATVSSQTTRVSLTPHKMGGAGTWCAGTFHGTIVQNVRPVCGPPLLCPQIEIRPQTIGRFSFKVKRRG